MKEEDKKSVSEELFDDLDEDFKKDIEAFGKKIEDNQKSEIEENIKNFNELPQSDVATYQTKKEEIVANFNELPQSNSLENPEVKPQPNPYISGMSSSDKELEAAEREFEMRQAAKSQARSQEPVKSLGERVVGFIKDFLATVKEEGILGALKFAVEQFQEASKSVGELSTNPIYDEPQKSAVAPQQVLENVKAKAVESVKDALHGVSSDQSPQISEAIEKSKSQDSSRSR